MIYLSIYWQYVNLSPIKKIWIQASFYIIEFKKMTIPPVR